MSASDQWMPLYISDYLADTKHLSARQHGAYLLLLMHHWKHGFLPDVNDQLARIAALTPREWRTDSHVIRQFFVSENGQLIQKRLKRELERSRNVSSSRSQAAHARYAKHSQSHNTNGANAPDMQRTTTTTSTEEERKTLSPVFVPMSPAAREEDTHTSERDLISKMWLPEAQDVLFAARIGLDVERQIPLFVDSLRARGVRTPDTAAAWRNWCRIAAERARPKLSPGLAMIYREGMERAMDYNTDPLEHLTPLPGGINGKSH
jgi:uncharacterized protein YdaU (DUF1376 family)